MDDFCFAKRNEEKTFAEATASCQQLGGFLAELRSEAMTTAVKTLSFETQFLWMGLKDNAKNRNFLWQTNYAALSYNDWYSDQPNNHNDKCVGINKFNLQWYDRPCDLAYEYICQTSLGKHE